MNAGIDVNSDGSMNLRLTQTRIPETHIFLRLWETIITDGDYPAKVAFGSNADEEFMLVLPLGLKAKREGGGG